MGSSSSGPQLLVTVLTEAGLGWTVSVWGGMPNWEQEGVWGPGSEEQGNNPHYEAAAWTMITGPEDQSNSCSVTSQVGMDL